MARHCRRDEGLEDSEKRWWCMMERGGFACSCSRYGGASLYVRAHQKKSVPTGPPRNAPLPQQHHSPRAPPPSRGSSRCTLPSANSHPGRLNSYINSSKFTCELPRPFELAKDAQSRAFWHSGILVRMCARCHDNAPTGIVVPIDIFKSTAASANSTAVTVIFSGLSGIACSHEVMWLIMQKITKVPVTFSLAW